MNEATITRYVSVPVDYNIRPTDDFRKDFDWVSHGYAEAKDWQRDERCKVVPTEGQAELDFELVHFNRGMTIQEVLEAMDSMDLHPATLEELVSFSRKPPELQREFWIAGLGSVCRWDGLRGVPFLHRTGFKRGLSLCWGRPGITWDVGLRFLAVHK